MKNFNSTNSSSGFLHSDSEGVQPFQGLLENEGHVYRNWGLSRSTQSAAYVEPISYADVQAVVQDTRRFPTPVHPVGPLLSVTSTIVNDRVFPRRGTCLSHDNWLTLVDFGARNRRIPLASTF